MPQRQQGVGLFNRHSTSCTLGGRPVSLHPSLSPFRPFSSPYNRHARLPPCFPATRNSPPSPLFADTRCMRRTERKRAREGVDIKDEEGERTQGQRVKGEVSYVHARAHDSCLHEWKVLLVSCCSGALVQWSTGNAWLHPVSVHGLATTCRKITE